MSVNWLNSKVAQIISDYNITPHIDRTKRIDTKSIFNNDPKIITPPDPIFQSNFHHYFPQNQLPEQNIPILPFLPLKVPPSPYELGYKAASNTDSLIELISSHSPEPFLPRIIITPEPTVIQTFHQSPPKTKSTQTSDSTPRKKSKNVIIQVDPLQEESFQSNAQHRRPDLATWQLEAARAVRDLYLPQKEEKMPINQQYTRENREIKDEVISFPHFEQKTTFENKSTDTLIREMRDRSIYTEKPNLVNTGSSTADYLQNQTRSCSPIHFQDFVDQSFGTNDDKMQFFRDRSTSVEKETKIEVEDKFRESQEIEIQTDNTWEIVEKEKRDQQTLTEKIKVEKENFKQNFLPTKIEDQMESFDSNDINSVLDSLLEYIGESQELDPIKIEVEQNKESPRNLKNDDIQNWMRNSFKERNKKYLEDRKFSSMKERKPFVSQKAPIKRRNFSEEAAKQKRYSDAYKMALSSLQDVQESKSFHFPRKTKTTEQPDPRKLKKLYGTSRLSSICNMINKNKKSSAVLKVQSKPVEDAVSLVGSDITEDIDWEEIDRLIEA